MRLREPDRLATFEPLIGTPLPLSGVRDTTSQWLEPRDKFPNNFVGDLVETGRGWVVVPRTCRLDGHAYSGPGWSVLVCLVYMQRAAHGVAMPLRRNPLRTGAGTALPNPRQFPVAMWEDEQRG